MTCVTLASHNLLMHKQASRLRLSLTDLPSRAANRHQTLLAKLLICNVGPETLRKATLNPELTESNSLHRGCSTQAEGWGVSCLSNCKHSGGLGGFVGPTNGKAGSPVLSTRLGLCCSRLLEALNGTRTVTTTSCSSPCASAGTTWPHSASWLPATRWFTGRS